MWGGLAPLVLSLRFGPPVLKKALMIAAAAHQGQVDKSGAPYLGHVLRVVGAAPDGNAKIVAALHDLVEDCPAWNLDRLAAEGFDADVLAGVAAITKTKGANYDDYLAGVKANALARAVKLADLADNMRLDRIPEPGPKDLKRLEKYAKAKAFLEG